MLKNFKINPKAKLFYTFVFMLIYLVFIHIIYQYGETKKEYDIQIEKNTKQKESLTNQLIQKGLSKDEVENILENSFSIDNSKYETKLFDKTFENIIIGFLFLFFIYPFLQAVRREIKEEQKVLSRQHRLAQLGELLNNIAHQFRQPLTQINATLASLENSFYKKTLDEKLLDEKITKIEDTTEYLSNTIEDFRNYFKPNKQKEKFMISEVIQSALNIISTQIKQNNIAINLNTINDKELNFPKGEYIQVLISIVSNSIDQAINKEIKNPKIDIVIDNNISVSDNAGGIKDEYLSKVFDLNFTTKEDKKGTGIGLYMAKILVENSFDGTIEVKNYQDGVEFKVKC